MTGGPGPSTGGPGPSTAGGEGAGTERETCTALLICPVCGDRLRRDGRSLRCPRRHTFDIARQGHVDLLPPGHGRTGVRGDTPEMVRARRRFLDRGHYAALAAAVTAHALEHLRSAAHEHEPLGGAVLEVGCGDGHYLGSIVRAIATTTSPPHPRAHPCFFGLDVSAAAVRAAAKRYPTAHFLVNDVRHRICMAAGSVDVLLNVFAPRNPQEFARVARPGALLIVVIPGTRHLAELRQHVSFLEIPDDKRDQTVDAITGSGAFQLVAEETLELDLTLDGTDVADALGMSPSAWHVAEADLDSARERDAVGTRASFVILRLRRLG